MFIHLARAILRSITCVHLNRRLKSTTLWILRSGLTHLSIFQILVW